jgi:hypothetical protein
MYRQNSGELRRENNVVMPGLDPGIHHLQDKFFEEDGSPGQAR